MKHPEIATKHLPDVMDEIAKIWTHPTKIVIFASEKHGWVFPSSLELKGIPKKKLWGQKGDMSKIKTCYASYDSYGSSIFRICRIFEDFPRFLFNNKVH